MLKKIMTNDFNKNVIKLMTGATVAQAIPVAISPILTRLYTPEDFGVLTLFIAVTAIFGSIANGRYELAIVLPDKEEDSINLVALSLLVAVSISTLLFVLVLLFHTQIISALGNEQIGPWLYIAPLVILFIGIFNALNYLNTRMKTFGVIAQVRVAKSVALAIVQIGIGLVKSGATGLISGQIISHVFSNGILARRVIKNKVLLSQINFKRIKKVANRYSNFPKFSLWAILANNLSQHLTSFFISLFYSVSTLGFYSLVQRILGMPGAIVGKAFGQVFFQKASEERKKRGNAEEIFLKTLKKLIIISAPFFILLFFIVEEVVSFVFGEEWRVAGEYAKLLLPFFFVRFINSPLSIIMSTFEKNHIGLIIQILNLILAVSIFVTSYVLHLSVKEFMLLYSFCYVLFTVARLLYYKKISKGK